jgi:hypothetical protein
LDDAVSASSRARVDAENRHGDTLGIAPDVPPFSLRPMRRPLLLVAFLVTGCGGQGGTGVFERAQAGLARVTSGTIELRVTVQALVPIERSAKLQVGEVPLAQLRLASWAQHPRSIACAEGLDCARADVNVEAALRDLKSVLPSLPFDPSDVRSAEMEVAIAEDGDRPRRLRLRGDLDPGLIPGTVPFEVKLEFSRPRSTGEP